MNSCVQTLLISSRKHWYLFTDEAVVIYLEDLAEKHPFLMVPSALYPLPTPSPPTSLLSPLETLKERYSVFFPVLDQINISGNEVQDSVLYQTSQEVMMYLVLGVGVGASTGNSSEMVS